MIAWISVLLLFVPIVFGEELPVLIEIAIRQNPKIQAERKNWEATIAKYPQAIALPDPMVMYGFYAKSVETRVGPQRHRISISQTVPYPRMLKTSGNSLKFLLRAVVLRFRIRPDRRAAQIVSGGFYDKVNAKIEKAQEDREKAAR